ncbi:transmembrane protein 127-like [Eriocheir sinensis]|uniref:transmembrane protein 127-like n=1 Tax=Eriocheir sinensis TaxID=95602 RepID=UPI0021CADD89|nr:transmembrane protein 127-like [Eriocheir sinensis]
MQAPPSYTSGPPPRHHRRCRPSACLDTERNLLSAVVNLLVVVVVCVAVFQPRWFWMEGGGCSTNTLSLYLFFLAGRFVKVKTGSDSSSSSSSSTSPSLISSLSSSSSSSSASVPSGGGDSDSASYIYYINGEELKSCVTPHIVSLLQVVIGLVFLMACAACVQLMMDLAGPAGRTVRCLRRNALPSIVAVWVCVVGVGVCYRLTILLEYLQEATKQDRVQVKFDVGFYLFVLAGGLSVLAVGCSWLRPAHIFQEPDGAPLMEDCGLEGLDSPGGALGYPFIIDREPPPPLEGNPPPPYTP